MDPQLLMPSPATDFHFDSSTSSPYATAPSSPKTTTTTNFFFSAPTSPTHSFFHHQEEERKQDDIDMDMDFAFDFSGQLDRPSISDADELFHGGKIKPLDPPSQRFRSPDNFSEAFHRTPRDQTQTPQNNFSEAFRRTPGDHQNQNPHNNLSEAFRRTLRGQTQNQPPRGRERTTTTTTAAATTRYQPSRSLSPMRVSDILHDDGHGNNQKVSTSQSFLPFAGFMWYNKWNLKNLLLFRSTSEGSAATIDDRFKSSSFRSNDGGGSGSVGSSSRRMMKRKVSAHEIHYTANRAVAEEMRRRRKTSLPYKSGLLGCLGFHHEISRGR